MRDIETIEREIVDNEIRDLVYQAKLAADDGRTEAAKLSGFNKSIKSLDKLMSAARDVTEIETAILRLREKRDNLQAVLKLDKAELLIAQSKKSRAKDLLIEVLFLIERDSVDDGRQGLLVLRAKDLLKQTEV